MTTFRISTPKKKNYYENLAWEKNSWVVGIDEVGCGCLAGPVVAAAVILPQNSTYRGLKDSKLLSQDELQRSAQWILKNAYVGIGCVSPRLIDKHNIYQASMLAMKRAYAQLRAKSPLTPLYVLVDAKPLKGIDGVELYAFNKGERASSSIAAASIVAKVWRDNLMGSLNQAMPGYQLADHKGYSTPLHKSSIKKNGHSLIHRLSYIDHFSSVTGIEQLSFFSDEFFTTEVEIDEQFSHE